MSGFISGLRILFYWSMSILMPVPNCFDYFNFAVTFEITKYILPILWVVLKIGLATVGPLHFPTNFRMNLAIFATTRKKKPKNWKAAGIGTGTGWICKRIPKGPDGCSELPTDLPLFSFRAQLTHHPLWEVLLDVLRRVLSWTRLYFLVSTESRALATTRSHLCDCCPSLQQTMSAKASSASRRCFPTSDHSTCVGIKGYIKHH